MSLRNTFYWVAGMLVGLGVLLYAAKSFFPDAGEDTYAMESRDAPPSELGPPVLPGGSNQEYSGPSEREDPDLDSWYAEAGSEQSNTFDDMPEGPVPGGSPFDAPPPIDSQGRFIGPPETY
ncbi:hypothetical protein K3175_11990 [Qipengyuania sp. GH1]|uniref:hypothetical protein n=1 Tax=Qipengyuania aestuarii TaxID=2867241 RepID=UPI001C871DD4|nr:hypothetical protein [Qipengyuania aestuarii]MBX7536378.1 hypothetical protein [Qipengyuania aestuarii]